MSAEPIILQDDGTFYIELNANNQPAGANGFLHRRCPVSLTTPGGFECVGDFTYQPNGLWRSGVTKAYEAGTDEDFLLLGEFKLRIEAIVAMWHNRHKAHCSH